MIDWLIDFYSMSTLLGWMHHHHHHQIMLITKIPLNLSCHSSLWFITLGRSFRLHSITELMYVSPCWSANIGTSMCRRTLLLYYFPSSALHVLFFLLGWFERWEASGCTAVVLLGVASRICSKQHIAFLRSSHLALSSVVSLESQRCYRTVVLTWLLLDFSWCVLLETM